MDDVLLDQFTLDQMDQWVKDKVASTEDISLAKALAMATAADQSP